MNSKQRALVPFVLSVVTTLFVCMSERGLSQSREVSDDESVKSGRVEALPGVGDFSRRFDEVATKAIEALVEARADDFRALVSPSTIMRETRGRGAIDKIIREHFIPFFADYERLTHSASSIPTHDPEGHKGIAICRSFETKERREKPFILYIVEEDGRLVVSNLLLDKRLVDIAPRP